jgi:hypothetical protein
MKNNKHEQGNHMSKIPPSPSPPRTMQWAGLIVVTILTIMPMVIAYIIKNPYYLAPSLPFGFVWRSLAKFLYKRPEDYYLDELKIKYHADILSQKKQIP